MDASRSWTISKKEPPKLMETARNTGAASSPAGVIVEKAKDHPHSMVIDLCPLSESSESEPELQITRVRSSQFQRNYGGWKDGPPPRKKVRFDDAFPSTPPAVVRGNDDDDDTDVIFDGVKCQIHHTQDDIMSADVHEKDSGPRVGASITGMTQGANDKSTGLVFKPETQKTGLYGSVFQNNQNDWNSTNNGPSKFLKHNTATKTLVGLVSNDRGRERNPKSISQEGQWESEKAKSDHAAISSLPPNVMVVEVRSGPDGSAVRHHSPDTPVTGQIKPEPRFEDIWTESGMEKRKFIGPFVSEDDDVEEEKKTIHRHSDPIFSREQDEGYGSFSSTISPKAEDVEQNKVSVIELDNILDSEDRYGFMNSGEIKTEEALDLFKRKKQTEDKNAEMSRRMREENLATAEKRRVGASHSGTHSVTRLSQVYLEELPRATSSPYEGDDSANDVGDANKEKSSRRNQAEGMQKLELHPAEDSVLTPNSVNIAVDTPKRPLEAALNVNGGLAFLARKVSRERAAAINSHSTGNQHITSEVGYNDAHGREIRPGVDRSLLDNDMWIKNTEPLNRKREVKRLIDTLTAAARVWFIAFDTMTSPQQSALRSNLLEVMRDFARPMILGYSGKSTYKRGGRRLNDIKHVMLKRIKSRDLHSNMNVKQQRPPPTQQQIEETLIDLIGHDNLKRIRALLRKVVDECERWKQEQKRISTHHSGGRDSSSQKTKPSRLERRARDTTESDSETKGRYRDWTLTKRQRLTWKKADDQMEQIRRALSRYDDAGDAILVDDHPPKKADPTQQDIWADGLVDAHEAQSEDSDEDEDGTAPSFGRLSTTEPNVLQEGARKRPFAASGREVVSGKGILPTDRRGERVMEERTPGATKRPTAARKSLPGLPTLQESEEEGEAEEEQSLQHRHWKSRTRQSVTLHIDQSDQDTRPGKRLGDSDTESDRSSSVDENSSVVDEIKRSTTAYDGMHMIQHEVLADYENFPDRQDGESESLGRHIDVDAARRQLSRVIRDITGCMTTRYRQLRLIWDITDSELVSQTLILPTGGQCCVRVAKSRLPITDWPGRRRLRLATKPKTFYSVRESRVTTLLKPNSAVMTSYDRWGEIEGPEDGDDIGGGTKEHSNRDGDENENEDEDSRVVENERDIYSSSRECANAIARNRLLGFIRRQGSHSEKATEEKQLEDYLEQIEHDRACFEQERVSCTTEEKTETGERRKKVARIKIWVEELMVDQAWD